MTCGRILPRLEQLEQRLEVRCVHLRLAPRVRAPEHADQRAAFQQRQVERNRRDLAARETDHQIAAVPRHAAHDLLGVVRADRIVGNVDTAIAGELHHFRLDRVLRVIEDGVRAVTFGEFQFFVRARRREHACAERLADLDGRQTNTARGAEHQQSFARP